MTEIASYAVSVAEHDAEKLTELLDALRALGVTLEWYRRPTNTAAPACIFCDGRPHDKRASHFARGER